MAILLHQDAYNLYNRYITKLFDGVHYNLKKLNKYNFTVYNLNIFKINKDHFLFTY